MISVISASSLPSAFSPKAGAQQQARRMQIQSPDHMKRPFRWCLFLLAPVLLAWGVIHVYRAATFKMYAFSPSRQVEIRGLRFQGVTRHPLDGCLRVYIYGRTEDFIGGIWQTTIKFGTDLSLEWRGDEHGYIAIVRGDKELMTWSVRDSRAVCTKGRDLITYDPHDLWMRTGSARPGPEKR